MLDSVEHGDRPPGEHWVAQSAVQTAEGFDLGVQSAKRRRHIRRRDVAEQDVSPRLRAQSERL